MLRPKEPGRVLNDIPVPERAMTSTSSVDAGKSKKSAFSFLLWWRTDPAEVEKQVAGYTTLSMAVRTGNQCTALSFQRGNDVDRKLHRPIDRRGHRRSDNLVDRCDPYVSRLSVGVHPRHGALDVRESSCTLRRCHCWSCADRADNLVGHPSLLARIQGSEPTPGCISRR